MSLHIRKSDKHHTFKHLYICEPVGPLMVVFFRKEYQLHPQSIGKVKCKLSCCVQSTLILLDVYANHYLSFFFFFYLGTILPLCFFAIEVLHD